MGDPRPAVANNGIEFLSSFILISAKASFWLFIFEGVGLV